jgi:hypothetical protein
MQSDIHTVLTLVKKGGNFEAIGGKILKLNTRNRSYDIEKHPCTFSVFLTFLFNSVEVLQRGARVLLKIQFSEQHFAALSS